MAIYHLILTLEKVVTAVNYGGVVKCRMQPSRTPPSRTTPSRIGMKYTVFAAI